MQVSQDQVQRVNVSGEDSTGSEPSLRGVTERLRIEGIVVDGYQIPVVLSVSEVATLLASYSPSSSSSPNEATSRQIARLVLDALLAAGA